MNQEKLTAAEIETLKSFAIAWLRVYSFMPPEGILSLFILIRRITERYEAQVRQIQSIQVSQISSTADFSRNLQHISNQSINRSMMS